MDLKLCPFRPGRYPCDRFECALWTQAGENGSCAIAATAGELSSAATDIRGIAETLEDLSRIGPTLEMLERDVKGIVK